MSVRTRMAALHDFGMHSLMIHSREGTPRRNAGMLNEWMIRDFTTPESELCGQ